MAIEKPPSIAQSPYKSAKWDEITEGRNFSQSDAPVIALLCQWYEVVNQCMDDIDIGDTIHVAYENNLGDIREMPQIGTMKKASAEIRALNKQLGINDEVAEKPKEQKRTPLNVISFNRQSRAENINSRKKRTG